MGEYIPSMGDSQVRSMEMEDSVRYEEQQEGQFG